MFARLTMAKWMHGYTAPGLALHQSRKTRHEQYCPIFICLLYSTHALNLQLCSSTAWLPSISVTHDSIAAAEVEVATTAAAVEVAAAAAAAAIAAAARAAEAAAAGNAW